MPSLLYLIIFNILCGVTSAVAGSFKGAGLAGFLLGLILGPFGLIIVILSPGKRVKCPYSKKYIDPEAVKCPYCQSDVNSDE